MINTCKNCGKETKNPKFCSRSCSATFNNKGVRRHGEEPGFCLVCNRKLATSKLKYCSKQCQHKYLDISYIKEWKEGKKSGNRLAGKRLKLSIYVDRYIRKKFDNKCTKCGWSEVNEFSGNIPVQIHHKDGNQEKSCEDNLDLLCPNCHSLTNNWGNIKRSPMV